MKNKLVTVLLAFTICHAPAMCLDPDRPRRMKKVAIRTLTGDLQLIKNYIKDYNTPNPNVTLFRIERRMIRGDLIRLRGDISGNYGLLDSNNPLLRDVIHHYNGLVEILKQNDDAEDNDFFWEPVSTQEQQIHASAPPRIQEITDDQAPLMITAGQDLSPITTVNTNRNTQNRCSFFTYAIISGIIFGPALVIRKLYHWAKGMAANPPHSSQCRDAGFTT